MYKNEIITFSSELMCDSDFVIHQYSIGSLTFTFMLKICAIMLPLKVAVCRVKFSSVQKYLLNVCYVLDTDNSTKERYPLEDILSREHTCKQKMYEHLLRNTKIREPEMWHSRYQRWRQTHKLMYKWPLLNCDGSTTSHKSLHLQWFLKHICSNQLGKTLLIERIHLKGLLRGLTWSFYILPKYN